MPKYKIKAHVRATIRETWIVEAENEEAALAGEWETMAHINDETLGDEEDREIVEATLLV